MGLSLGTGMGIMFGPAMGNVGLSMIMGSSIGMTLGIVAWVVMSAREKQ